MFKIFLNAVDWATKQAIYHKWMEDNVAGYKDNTECWAKVEWSKHPDEEKWILLIPSGHPDEAGGEEWTEDWRTIQKFKHNGKNNRNT